jgi:hypothetical protein
MATRKPVSCSAFTQFLIDQQPNYDRYIIRDIRPKPFKPYKREIPLTAYQITLLTVRKISEGIAFVPQKKRFQWIRPQLTGWLVHVNTELFNPLTGLEHAMDRFREGYNSIKWH